MAKSWNMLRPIAGGLVAVMLALPPAALAATPSPNAGGAIAQSYPAASADIAAGTLLSLDRTSGKAGPAKSGDATAALVGVAVSQPLVQLSGTAQSMVQAAVGGTTQVLVSDINGDIKTGDKIAASPLEGIGMRAAVAGEIVGTAQANLASVTRTSREVTDKAGKKVTAHIGLIPVSVNVEFYSAGASGNLSSFVPSFLQNLADSIAGKAVSPLRVIIAVIILLIGTVTVIVMLSSGIKNGIISLGRNPLAEHVLIKGLVDIIISALGVLLITFVAVYAVLSV
jgi:hypothetical protein